ncbi:MAG: sulfite exporter TauE/SafE family protein [Thermoflexales bacterium]|nr:sulfite exporter TauE/SafE family protein [Thermoflexales bacterium]MDW8351989.1 sulfite exporter TauE/SafE family protein [Anaerolineae bacterium]
MLLQLALGFAIGLSLGLLGGGGSILTVPALVYVMGYHPGAAVTASLAIVGVNSLSGVLVHRRQGTLNWQVALVFGGVGMITAYFAARLSHSFPPLVLMMAFALLMLVVGGMMLRGRRAGSAQGEPRGLATTLAAGAGVGLLTGFLGVGGGFLIVPALVMLVGLPMPVAVGTSLLVIAMNSLSGLLGHLNGAALDWQLIALFATAGIAGAFVGSKLTRLIHPDRLRQAFGIFVILLAIYLLYDNGIKLLR